jgi:hypothetical protein
VCLCLPLAEDGIRDTAEVVAGNVMRSAIAQSRIRIRRSIGRNGSGKFQRTSQWCPRQA